MNLNIKESFYIHKKIRFKIDPEASFREPDFVSCEICTKRFQKSKIEKYIRIYHWAWVKERIMFWLYLPKSHFYIEANLNIRPTSDKFIYAERRYVDLYIQSSSVLPEITYKLFYKKIFPCGSFI